MAPLLRAEALSRHLGPRRLWHRLSFDLGAGERLALLGPTGSGKTLLLRALSLLDPLESGRLLLRGQPPMAWTVPIYRARVLLLPQRAVAFAGTVEANLRAVFELGVHRRRRFDRQRLLGWLEQLGRGAAFLDQPAERLSGGETQLLALLRALQLDPDVLLLDESCAALDAVSTGRLEGLLRQWLEGGERACLFTSHDGAQVERFATRRLALEPGPEELP